MQYDIGHLSSFARVKEGLRVYRDHFFLFMKLAAVLALPPCLVGAAVAPALAGSTGSGPGEQLASSLALSACSILAQMLLGVGVREWRLQVLPTGCHSSLGSRPETSAGD